MTFGSVEIGAISYRHSSTAFIFGVHGLHYDWLLTVLRFQKSRPNNKTNILRTIQTQKILFFSTVILCLRFIVFFLSTYLPVCF